MKRILILLIGLVSIAYGQSAPTSAKTRFVNGLYVGTKLDAYFAAADSNAIYWRADSALMAKYKGTARRIVFSGELGAYKAVSDTFFTNGYTTMGRTKQVIDSLGADAGIRFVTLATPQTISGQKTFSSDAYFNGLRIGRGNGNLVGNTGVGLDVFRDNTTGAENTAFGSGVLIINTTGSQNAGFGYRALYNNMTGGSNTAIGYRALTVASNSNNTAVGNQSLASTTSGSSNTSVGSDAMNGNTTGSQNTALGQTALNQNTTASTNTGVGYQALLGTTTGGGNTALGHNSGTTNSTGTNNTYIGLSANASANNRTNETVIGYNATGNGSNTVTIGNSSVTNNYFTGKVNGTGNFNVNGAANVDTAALNVSGSSLFRTSTSLRKHFTLAQQSDATSGWETHADNSGNYSLSRFNSGVDAGVIFSISSAGTITNNGANLTLGTTTGTGTGRVFSKNIFFSSATFGTSGSPVDEEILGYSYNSDSKFSIEAQNSYNSNQATGFRFKITDGAGTAIYPITVSRGVGDITMPNVYTATVGGTNRDVFVDNTGLLGYVTSFKASKKNIQPIYSPDWLHNLTPVTFNYRVKDSLGKYTDSAYKELEYGLVAEEVETVNKEMVFYDVDSLGNKKLRGVHYSKLIIPLLAEIQEHKKKLDAQQSTIQILINRIEKLEAKLN